MPPTTTQTRPVRTPGPEHPIAIDATGVRVVVRVDGHAIADSVRALTLTEASYPPVHYLPRDDVAMDALVRSTKTSYCPYKGDCVYYSIASAGPRGVDAVWSYESPYPAVEAIAGHLAFYPDRVDAIELAPAA